MKKVFNLSNLYLGIFLILLGAVLLLDNLGVFHIDKRHLLHLWPFLLIVWGLKYIPMSSKVRFWVNMGIMFLFFALLVFGKPRTTFFTGFDSDFSVFASDDEAEESSGLTVSQGKDFHFMADLKPEIQKASLELVVGAGELNIENPTEKLFEFIGENIPYDLKKEIRFHGDAAEIKIRPASEHKSVKWRKANDLSMEVKLHPDIVWDLDLTAGAAQLSLDLKDFKIRNLEIHAGAADMDIILGDKYPDVKVRVEAGASDLRIHVPRTAAVELKVTNVLGVGTFEGLTQVRKGLYRSENYESNSPKIHLEILSAAGNFELKRY